MTQQFTYSSSSKLDKAMSQEQFTQIVDAILSGKYSWACVLILRFAGYNPLHYIPYRTYNRLVKDNAKVEKESFEKSHNLNTNSPGAINRSNVAEQRSNPSKIRDLNYLEPVKGQHATIRGGTSRTPQTAIAADNYSRQVAF